MFYHHTFPNGLTLLAETQAYRKSFTMVHFCPVGSSLDPRSREGLTALLCEMLLRGGGKRGKREFLEAMETLGILRSEEVLPFGIELQGSVLSENWERMVHLYADMLREPQLPKEEWEAVRQLQLQEAIDEDPAEALMKSLRREFYGNIWGHDAAGTKEALQEASWKEVVTHYQKWFRPNGMILAAYGNVEWEELLNVVQKRYGDWYADRVSIRKSPGISWKPFHLAWNSAQTHIGLAWETLPFAHPDQMRAWGGMSVLSDGTGGRLYNVIREKHGLCYFVEATCQSLQGKGGVFCLMATRPEMGRRALELLLEEINHLRDGISYEEWRALKFRLKSSLVRLQESPAAWCHGMVYDWYHFGYIRTPEEILQQIEELTLDSINDYLAREPVTSILIGTCGPAPILDDLKGSKGVRL